MPMLLTIKQRVDNTFEYKGGLGKVSERVFHKELKHQLKMKRHYMKKALLARKPKPPHIREDQCVGLSQLIKESRKINEASKLNRNRASGKPPPTSPSDGTAINLEGSKYNDGSPSSKQPKIGASFAIAKRIDGLESSMKLVLAALQIKNVESAPPKGLIH